MEVVKIKKHKLAGDHQDHFVILDDQGEEFKVAKHALDPLTQEKIYNLQKVENYNCGGEVKGYADGGEAVLEKSVTTPEASATIEQTVPTDALAEQIAAPQASPQYVPQGKGGSGIPGGAIWDSLTKTRVDADPSSIKKYGSVDEAMKAAEFYKKNQPPAIVPPLSSNTTDAAQPPSDIVNIPPQPQQPQQQPQIADPVSEYQKMVQEYSANVGTAVDQYERDTKEQAALQTKIYENFQKNSEMLYKTTDALQSQAQDIINNGISGKVNPDKYWQDKGLVGQVTSVIGMMISGAGAFAYGGRNLAADAISNAIERDIDAQKANIQQKNNLLSQNFELTKNMFLAQDMLRMQLTASVGAIADIASTKGLSHAQREKYMTVRLAIAEKLDLQKKNLAKMLTTYRLTSPDGGGATSADLMLNPDAKENAVKLPGKEDRYGITFEKKGAEEIRKAQTTKKIVLPIIKDLAALMKSSGPADYNKIQLAKALAARLKLSLGTENELGALAKDDLEIINTIAGNPAVIFTKSLQASKLDDMIERANQKVDALIDTHVLNYKRGEKPPK